LSYWCVQKDQWKLKQNGGKEYLKYEETMLIPAAKGKETVLLGIADLLEIYIK